MPIHFLYGACWDYRHTGQTGQCHHGLLVEGDPKAQCGMELASRGTGWGLAMGYHLAMGVGEVRWGPVGDDAVGVAVGTGNLLSTRLVFLFLL